MQRFSALCHLLVNGMNQQHVKVQWCYSIINQTIQCQLVHTSYLIFLCGHKWSVLIMTMYYFRYRGMLVGWGTAVYVATVYIHCRQILPNFIAYAAAVPSTHIQPSILLEWFLDSVTVVHHSWHTNLCDLCHWCCDNIKQLEYI